MNFTPKLTSMVEGVIVGLAVEDGGQLGKALKGSLARVPETMMPSDRRRNG